MKTNDAKPKQKFYLGDQCRLMHFVEPVLSGSIVAVKEIGRHRGEYRYQVQATEYAAAPVWVYEDDLEWVIA